MYIEQTSELEAFIAGVMAEAQGGAVAVDTEFVRERTYWPELCLVQIATPTQAAVIDALAVNLEILKPLLLHPEIVKVFHSARQDYEIFWHELRLLPHPLFDTQIGAMYAGYGEGISYETLIHKTLGLRVDKSVQYTNWARRPLSEQQLAYALADVQHMIAAYPFLKERLQTLGRESWPEEDINHLLQPSCYETNPQEAWQRLHCPNGHGQSLALLQDLAAWRERQAQERNWNRGRVLKDDILVRLAGRPPAVLTELKETLSQENKEVFADELFAVVQKSVTRPSHTWPNPMTRKPVAVKDQQLLDLLRLLQRAVAVKLEIPPRLLVYKGELEKIANQEPLENVSCFTGWRYQAFGCHVEAVMTGKIGLTYAGGQLRIQDSGSRSQESGSRN